MMHVLPVKPHDEPPLFQSTMELGLINRMNVAAITNDGAFTTRRSRSLHAKQESEVMTIVISVLANLGLSTVGSPYLVPRYCPAR